MRVYVAGPMSGKPLYNKPAFEAAAEFLRGFGYDVVIPHDLNSVVWRKHNGRDFDPAVDRAEYGDPIVAELIESDLIVVCRADAIALLAGWQQSKGARLEVLLAETLGKVILDAQTGEQIVTTLPQHMAAYGRLNRPAPPPPVEKHVDYIVPLKRGGPFGALARWLD